MGKERGRCRSWDNTALSRGSCGSVSGCLTCWLVEHSCAAATTRLQPRAIVGLPEGGVSIGVVIWHNARMEKDDSSGRLPKEFSPRRMEAFSDGVIAVIITIMVLELRPPGGTHILDLWKLHSQFLVYVLSFVYIGTYWNNHHHLLRATPHIDGAVMWANLHLLFWLSLIPAATAWAGEDLTAQGPAVAYGTLALLTGFAYGVLLQFIFQANKGTDIERAIGGDFKGKISLVIYGAGTLLALLNIHIVPYLIYASVEAIWFIPDRRLVGR